MNATITETSAGLAARWRELMATEPKLRIRDAATRLGVSEAELLATRCGSGAEGGTTVTRLRIPQIGEFLPRLKALGRVKVLTRNEHCVHERCGNYENIELAHGGRIGLVTGKDIDLRLFLGGWKLAFAVADRHGQKTLHSFQFFDAHGGAIHKVYLDNEAGLKAFEELAAEFRHLNQAPEQSVEPVPPAKPELPDSEVDAAALRQGWTALKDTHEFFPLLARLKVGRLQALRLGAPEFAKRARASGVRTMLEEAARERLPIMVFVGNDHAIQIHTGTVTKLAPAGEWFNVLDPDFNLHLRESGVASAWLVRKPTADGDVNSLELFDAEARLVAQFFGARKPGQPELPEWRALLLKIPLQEIA